MKKLLAVIIFVCLISVNAHAGDYARAINLGDFTNEVIEQDGSAECYPESGIEVTNAHYYALDFNVTDEAGGSAGNCTITYKVSPFSDNSSADTTAFHDPDSSSDGNPIASNVTSGDYYYSFHPVLGRYMQICVQTYGDNMTVDNATLVLTQ